MGSRRMEQPGIMCTFWFSLQGKLRVRGRIRELCVQPNSKAFGVWPDLQNLIVRLYCVLQYLRDLQSASRGSLLGAWLLQTFPPSTCTASMLTVQCPLSPHSPVMSLTCLIIPRETQREAELPGAVLRHFFPPGVGINSCFPSKDLAEMGVCSSYLPSVFSSKVPWGNSNHFSFSLLVISFELCCSGWQCCFFPYRSIVDVFGFCFFFLTILNFLAQLSHSSLEISSEFGSGCDWIDLCCCQYFFRGQGEREKEKNEGKRWIYSTPDVREMNIKVQMPYSQTNCSNVCKWVTSLCEYGRKKRKSKGKMLK